MTPQAAMKSSAFMNNFAINSAIARRYGTCAMCPETRKIKTENGKTYVYCPKCGDPVEVQIQAQ